MSIEERIEAALLSFKMTSEERIIVLTSEDYKSLKEDYSKFKKSSDNIADTCFGVRVIEDNILGKSFMSTKQKYDEINRYRKLISKYIRSKQSKKPKHRK